jgi:two-component system sensor histidine kinase NreB
MLEHRDGSVVLLVEDDGVGFEPGRAEEEGRGIGLLGMRERAGLIGAALDIESTPGDGTTVFLRYPTAGGTVRTGS